MIGQSFPKCQTLEIRYCSFCVAGFFFFKAHIPVLSSWGRPSPITWRIQTLTPDFWPQISFHTAREREENVPMVHMHIMICKHR